MIPPHESIHLEHPIPVEIINDNSLQGPVYHPGEPSRFAWKAGNDAASQYQGILSVWKNMIVYLNKSQKEHGYDSKLQIKSGTCELKTLLDILPQMHKTIVNHPIYNKSGLRPRISITPSELEDTHRLYKKVNIEKSRAQNKIQKIRNSIGAHFSDVQISTNNNICKTNKRSSREKISWDEVTLLWQSLEVSSFTDLIIAMKSYIDFINTLPIYEWYRHEKNGAIRTHIPRTGTVDDSGKEVICIMSENMKTALTMNTR